MVVVQDGRVSNSFSGQRVHKVGVRQPHRLVQRLDEHVASLRQQRRRLIEMLSVDITVRLHRFLQLKMTQN